MSRPKSSQARRCPVNGMPMRKKGFTKAGTQRWKCDACRLGSTAEREEAAAWLADLNQWHGEYGDYPKECAKAKDDPVHAVFVQ